MPPCYFARQPFTVYPLSFIEKSTSISVTFRLYPLRRFNFHSKKRKEKKDIIPFIFQPFTLATLTL